MSPEVSGTESTIEPAPRRRFATLPRLIVAVVLLYVLVAYVLLPVLWRRHEKHHPALADAPQITHTAEGIPGDPLNVGLVGIEEDIHRAMLAANWYPADAVTLSSSLRIAADVVLRRPFDEAPVSPLYLYGRKQDLAFERPVGDDPRKRHHVRFWRSDRLDERGRLLWLGAATFDTHVGLSHDSGQITHHISPDVDQDRDLLMSDLDKADVLSAEEWLDGFHKVLQGKNGGGDLWRTDGRLAIGVLAAPTPVQTQGSRQPEGHSR